MFVPKPLFRSHRGHRNVAAEYAQEPTQTRTETPPRMSLAGVRGTYGGVLIASFVLVLVGGIVATVVALDTMGVTNATVETVSGLVLGLLAIAAALMIWTMRHEVGGIFALVAGVVFLVMGPETAGLFAVLGGVLALVARRVADVVS